MDKILILDAQSRSALAATRSLGQKGLYVVAADVGKNSLSGTSRYCRESFTYPSPYDSPDAFAQCLIEQTHKRDINVLFPVTEVTTAVILRYRNQLAGVSIPFCDLNTFNWLNDKYEVFKFAQMRKIPIPRTYFVESPETLTNALAKISFPAVLKPHRSRIYSDGRWITTYVRYASSKEEINSHIRDSTYLQEHPFLIQEYVHGQGQGVSALYDHGRPIAFFGHKRIREKPPSGGVSVLSESVELNPTMRTVAETIFGRAGFHGIGMVEYKVTPDGDPYLIEVNARFWGSLQLAIDAGVDFPYLLYELAIGKTPQEISHYSVGIRNRWLLGDLDRLYLVLKGDPMFHASWRARLSAIAEFCKFLQKDTRYEVNRWGDLRPFLAELRNYALAHHE